jgi:hypothetical protein
MASLAQSTKIDDGATTTTTTTATAATSAAATVTTVTTSAQRTPEQLRLHIERIVDGFAM